MPFVDLDRYLFMLSRLLYHFLSYPHYIIYIAIFFLMIFLGEEMLLIIGALTHLGYIDFWDAFIFAVLGTFAGDIFWFKIGQKYGEGFIAKCGKWFFITPERFKKIEGVIKRNGGIFIFISKFMYNLNHISLVAAGAIKFNFRKFIKYQIFISLVWVFCFMALGNIFAYNLSKIKHDVTLFTIIVLLVFASFVLTEKLVRRIAEKFIHSPEDNE